MKPPTGLLATGLGCGCIDPGGLIPPGVGALGTNPAKKAGQKLTVYLFVT